MGNASTVPFSMKWLRCHSLTIKKVSISLGGTVGADASDFPTINVIIYSTFNTTIAFPKE